MKRCLTSLVFRETETKISYFLPTKLTKRIERLIFSNVLKDLANVTLKLCWWQENNNSLEGNLAEIYHINNA